jgi:aryl-alcohol dehydrogenase-like predicted oxidoreductase
MGLASGFGVPTASIEKAFHEYGINYLWLSVLLPRNMVPAIHNLAPKHREEMCIVLAWPSYGGFFLQRYVERWLKKLKIDQVDLVVIQGQDKPPNQKFIDRVQRLRESGKARFVGMSSHERPLFGQIARGELEVPVDFFQIRYNAVHPGAEEDIFPYLSQDNRPGIIIYTASSWGQLFNPKLLPEGELPLDSADPYRFVLSHPDVNVVATAPSTAEQMEENLKALELGPLDEQEMTRIRRIGKHIYENG